MRHMLLTLLIISFVGVQFATAQIEKIEVSEAGDLVLPKTTDIHPAMQKILTSVSECEISETICELYERFARDSYLGQIYSTTFAQAESDVESIGGLDREAFAGLRDRVTSENEAWLKEILTEVHWFDIRHFGKRADTAAFLILQHSQDADFQKRILDRLEPLAEIGGTQSRNVAYLMDRVLIRNGELQKFGTQGTCNSQKEWRAFDVLEPDGLAVRRDAFGLEPRAEYEAGATIYCR